MLCEQVEAFSRDGSAPYQPLQMHPLSSTACVPSRCRDDCAGNDIVAASETTADVELEGLTDLDPSRRRRTAFEPLPIEAPAAGGTVTPIVEQQEIRKEPGCRGATGGDENQPPCSDDISFCGRPLLRCAIRVRLREGDGWKQEGSLNRLSN